MRILLQASGDQKAKSSVKWGVATNNRHLKAHTHYIPPMPSPTVSICLPVYNGANFLSQAIESVLAQTFEDFELLIADDCSTDDTGEIIAKYAARDKRIKSWRNAQNLKLFGNYNVCIEQASGKYIKLFAHDDLFERDLIKKMAEVLDNNPQINLVSSARHWIDAEGKVIEPDSDVAEKTMMPFKENTRVDSNRAIASTLSEVINWLGEPSSQMFRKEHADGGYDTSFRQIGDLEYSYRLLKGGDYFFLADSKCNFRRHAESWSTARSTDLTALMDWFLLGSKYKSYLESIPMSSEAYCMNVIRALTRNFESNLYQSDRLGAKDREDLLKSLCEGRDPLSFFKNDKNAERDILCESRAMAAIAFMATAALENELRLVNAEVATPHQTLTDVDRCEMSTEKVDSPPSEEIVLSANGSDHPSSDQLNIKIRPGIAKALAGIRRTLRAQDQEIGALKGALSEMGNSVSWKVTEPLRMLKRRLR